LTFSVLEGLIFKKTELLIKEGIERKWTKGRKRELNDLFVIIPATLSVAQIIIASSGRMTGE
jgi:hypothetical protein